MCVINFFKLVIVFCNQTRFITFQGSNYIVFDFVNPFKSNKFFFFFEEEED